MALPLIVCSATPDGSGMCMRTDGVENELLAAFGEPSQHWPLALMVLDQKGKVATHAVTLEEVTRRLEKMGAKRVEVH